MLSPERFREYLSDRRAAGETLAGIGRSFGVTHEAVRKWIAGGEASCTVLILAGLLHRGGEWPLSG